MSAAAEVYGLDAGQAAGPWWPSKRQPRILEGFLAGEIFCQLALLLPGLNAGPMRVLWRTGVFAASIGLVFLLSGRKRALPPAVAAFWVMGLVALQLFNPTGNTWLAMAAQCAMYLAVLGPLFWLPRLNVDAGTFRRVLLLFWGYYTFSTFVGLIQVYFPGHFQPTLSPVVASMGAAVEGLKITLASGQRVFRPMGLTDTPGGAADAGMWAVLFGLGFLLTARPGTRWWRKAMYLVSMGMGMMCIYLSQTRVLLVMVAIWFVVLLGLLVWRRRWRQFWVLAAMVAVIGGGSYFFSARVGGRGVQQRLATLAGSGRTASTYSQDRGIFLRQTIDTLIPSYPLGAGLGRWGMMNAYFGNNRDPRTGLIYVEIQWQGWVLDGGVPLLLGYLALLAVTMLSLWRVAQRRGPMWMWAALCLAYDVSILALCFDYTPFTGEMGLEFWFINALILTAAICIPARPQGAVRPAAPGRH